MISNINIIVVLDYTQTHTLLVTILRIHEDRVYFKLLKKIQ